MSDETLRLLLEKNPGIVNLLLTGVLLPLAIVYLTGRNSRREKRLQKDLDVKYSAKEDVRQHEKAVFASLSQILFEVQQLHVALSGTCVDEECIMNALGRFDNTIGECHAEISSLMLYLPSVVINSVYQCYDRIGKLKLELRELNRSKAYDLAHVAVHRSSSQLAGIIIEIQAQFVQERAELRAQFDGAKQEYMKHCCGMPPPPEVTARYLELRESLLANGTITRDEAWSR